MESFLGKLLNLDSKGARLNNQGNSGAASAFNSHRKEGQLFSGHIPASAHWVRFCWFPPPLQKLRRVASYPHALCSTKESHYTFWALADSLSRMATRCRRPFNSKIKRKKNQSWKIFYKPSYSGFFFCYFMHMVLYKELGIWYRTPENLSGFLL